MGIVCADESSLDVESPRLKSWCNSNCRRRLLLLPLVDVSMAVHLAFLARLLEFIVRNVLLRYKRWLCSRAGTIFLIWRRKRWCHSLYGILSWIRLRRKLMLLYKMPQCSRMFVWPCRDNGCEMFSRKVISTSIRELRSLSSEERLNSLICFSDTSVCFSRTATINLFANHRLSWLKKYICCSSVISQG